MRARVVPAALLALCACAAHADPRPLWELGAGAAVISFPDYRGSNEQRQYLLPLPYLVYRGEVLQVDRDKVRGLLFKRDRVELDVSVNGSVPIRSSHNAARSGMPDLDPTLELGPSSNVSAKRRGGSSAARGQPIEKNAASPKAARSQRRRSIPQSRASTRTPD